MDLLMLLDAGVCFDGAGGSLLGKQQYSDNIPRHSALDGLDAPATPRKFAEPTAQVWVVDLFFEISIEK